MHANQLKMVSLCQSRINYRSWRYNILNFRLTFNDAILCPRYNSMANDVMLNLRCIAKPLCIWNRYTISMIDLTFVVEFLKYCQLGSCTRETSLDLHVAFVYHLEIRSPHTTKKHPIWNGIHMYTFHALCYG